MLNVPSPAQAISFAWKVSSAPRQASWQLNGTKVHFRTQDWVQVLELPASGTTQCVALQKTFPEVSGDDRGYVDRSLLRRWFAFGPSISRKKNDRRGCQVIQTTSRTGPPPVGPSATIRSRGWKQP